MTTIHERFRVYEASHQHSINRAMHYVAIPAIMLSTAGLLWVIPFPLLLHPALNWATLAMTFMVLLALPLSWRLAAGLSWVLLTMSFLVKWLFERMPSFALFMSGLFILAWILQFIGHHIERKRPSFLEDLHFLLIGPLWILAKIYRKANIPW